MAVADPGFAVGGGANLVRGAMVADLRMWLDFEDFVCQNERIGTLGGGGHAPDAPPLDPPMNGESSCNISYRIICSICEHTNK